MTDTITLPRAEFEKIKVTLEENNQHHIDYDEHGGYDGSDLQEKNLQAITIAVAALAQQAEQAGWVMVPITPTPEMINAGRTTPMPSDSEFDEDEDYRAVYKAMLAAAPKGVA